MHKPFMQFMVTKILAFKLNFKKYKTKISNCQKFYLF